MEVIDFLGKHAVVIFKFLGIICTVIAGMYGVWKVCYKPCVFIYKLVKKLMYEFSDNGGGSVKDKVNKGVTMIGEMNRKIDGIVGRQMAFFYEAPTPMFLSDNKGACVDVNKAWVKLTGLPKDLAIGHGWHKIVVQEDLQRIEEEGEDFINDGSSYDTTFKINYYGTDKIIFVHCTGSKVYDSQHNLLSVIGTYEKI